MNITILATGTWGTALAIILSERHKVTLWSISEDEVRELRATRRHKNLPGSVIPDGVEITADLELAVRGETNGSSGDVEDAVSAEGSVDGAVSSAAGGADVIIIATPSVFVRSTVEKLKPLIAGNQIIVCVAKGMESGTLFTMSEIINDVLKGSNAVVALSGPTHAEEVALNLPTLIVSSSSDEEAARVVQNLFVGTCIRPYTNGDIKGIELCGALKNIIALACGIATGLGYGDNTRAAIITRGMAEIRNLGRAMGALEETFSGLAGIGDMIVTATSQHSRNNRAGQLIGQGLSPKEAVEKVGMVVEGIYALPAAMELAEKYGVELPIISAVNDIVNNNVSARDAVKMLLNRDIRSELSRPESDLRYENELLNQRGNMK